MIKRLAIVTISCAIAFVLYGENVAADEVAKKIVLFNGRNLDNFYTFIRGQGKNKDPKEVFTVKNGMIRVSGEEYGFFITNKEYENYRLIAEFKWGKLTFPPRKDRSRDSGILLHCVGPDKVWMESIEYQLIEGGTGDFILVRGKSTPTMKANIKKIGKQSYYHPKGKPQLFKGGRINWYGRDPKWKDVVGFRGKQDVEKPVGEWNLVECICDSGTIINKLNGVVVNRGFEASHTKGKILFQSEGAEVFFRRIELLPLKK